MKDPSASQTSSEEKLNHEAQELEKRLSLLSHRCSTGISQNTHNTPSLYSESKITFCEDQNTSLTDATVRFLAQK